MSIYKALLLTEIVTVWKRPQPLNPLIGLTWRTGVVQWRCFLKTWLLEALLQSDSHHHSRQRPSPPSPPPKCFLSEKSHFVPAHSFGFFFAKGRFSLKTLFSDDFILMWKKIWNRCKNLLVRKSYECLVTPFPSLYLKCFSSSTVHFTIIEILKVVWKFIFVTGMRRILIWTFLK